MASAGARREAEGGTLGGPCTLFARSLVHKWAAAASFFLPLGRHQPHECCTGGKFGRELRLCVFMIVSSFWAHRRRLNSQVALELFQGTRTVEAERGSGHAHPPSPAANLNSGCSLSMSDQHFLVINKLCCAKSSYSLQVLCFEFLPWPQSRWGESYRDPRSPVDQASCAPVRVSSFFYRSVLCESRPCALWTTGPPPNPHGGIFGSCSLGWVSLCWITDLYLQEIFLLPHTSSEMLTAIETNQLNISFYFEQ